ncbi:TRAP transporter substrate-binding protein [Lutibaculum baratangense]|uniref:TRAP-type C4-dicarboxylate transport system, periplasmic component n=1 Tax=Lutibaculum baratangense AMV1 TaxID=631454 RepID=V4RW32_9HYPH|nr:TRAP transporter substrate-binding protein [Lutibaculum baratangense]ESR27245.1 TRAP-type C4-dicarboxylate transport system, periplasmic component [Lutibaculum baratangense AMV1]
MFDMTRRSLVAAAAAMAITLSFGTAEAAQTLRIGWTTSDGEKDPYAIAARQFAAELEEALPGKFDVKYFPNNELGDEKQMLEALNFGTMDAAVITNAPIANIEPGFQVNDMPFLYADEAQAHEVLDGEVGQELMQRLEAKGIVGLGFAEGGFRHMINNSKPVAEPGDVSGIKFRVMQNPVFIEMFQSLGGNAVPMAWGETFTAAQQGTIDGLEIPLAVIASNKYADVVKYLSLTKHTYSALGLLVSKRFWDRLSEDEQQAVQEAADRAIATQREMNAANSAELIAQLEASGMQVNDIGDAAAFREKVRPVYDSFKASIGEDLFDKALAQVE